DPSQPEVSTDEITAFRRASPESIRIQVATEDPVWLHLAECDDGNWRLLIDGEPRPLYRGNLAFMAIALPDPGQHTIELSYRPTSFLLGIAISLFATAIAVGLFTRAFQTPLGPASARSVTLSDHVHEDED
ncbi:MAG: YfhO family protein, partial [Planctomycetes bacterium]|nr:YfhO family protein [Planctomycetota bacterium]